MGTMPDQVKVSNRAYTVLGLLFIYQTLNFFDKLVFGLSAVPMMHDLHLSPRQFGLIGSLFFLLFSASGMLVGLFAIGRIGTRWILAALVLIWSISQLSVLFAESVIVLAACRILLGVGEGPGLPTALHACYDWFPANRRSVPSAVILQGISAGFLVGGPLLTAIIVNFGWRAGFFVCFALGICWLIAWSVFGGDGPYAAPATVTDGKGLPWQTLWLDRTVLGVAAMSFMSYYVVGMAATWLPPYLQLGLSYRPVTAGWIISAIFAFQSPLLLFGSWLCQAMQRRGWSGRVALGHACTVALLAAGVALIAATRTGGTPRLVLIAIGFAAPALTTVYGPVILGLVAPPAQRGRLIVVIYSANALAGLVSTYGTGWIVGAAGADLPAGFAAAIALAGAMLIAGAAASLLLIFPDRSAARFVAQVR